VTGHCEQSFKKCQVSPLRVFRNLISVPAAVSYNLCPNGHRKIPRAINSPLDSSVISRRHVYDKRAKFSGHYSCLLSMPRPTVGAAEISRANMQLFKTK
jgi:hypothetical protein